MEETRQNTEIENDVVDVSLEMEMGANKFTPKYNFCGRKKYSIEEKIDLSKLVAECKEEYDDQMKNPRVMKIRKYKKHFKSAFNFGNMFKTCVTSKIILSFLQF